MKSSEFNSLLTDLSTNIPDTPNGAIGLALL